MGPTCEVLIPKDDGPALDAIHRLLLSIAEKVQATRKGRVWDVWIRGRPVHVRVADSPPSVELAAGCKQPEDYDVLREIAQKIAALLGGNYSEPKE